MNVKITQETANATEAAMKAETSLPAVDTSGNGVVGKLTTEIRPGSGQVLLDASSVLNFPDTQLSARIAAKAAADYMKKDISMYDVIYSIRANATVVEGPSAGLSMAVSAVMAFRNASMRDDIMMTGAIDEKGSVLPVGSIFEKANAAKAGGARIFLVPPNQSSYSDYMKKTSCKPFDGFEVCRTDYEPQKAGIGSLINITVAEVISLEDAVKYFIQ